MEPDADEVVFDAPEHFRIYKSGRIDRFHRPVLVPAGVDDATGVASRDVVLDAGTGVSVRLFLPNLQDNPKKKLPILVYFHVPQLPVLPRRRGRRPRRVRGLPPRPGAPAPRGLRRLLGRAAVGRVVGPGQRRRVGCGPRRHGPRLRRRRQRRRQHRAQRAGEGGGRRTGAEDRGRGPAPPVLRRERGHRRGDGARGRDRRQSVGVRVPRRGQRRRRPADQPGGAGAGAPRLRPDAGVRGGEGLAGAEGPRVLRRRDGERVARERGVAGDGRGGARLLPAQARVRQGQGAHGPRSGVHRSRVSRARCLDHIMLYATTRFSFFFCCCHYNE
ncbi:hypothetical protein QOZ80_6BG0491010 [Eleusine coracana subsp. coracana]|nr:hypothetical protein QOZ80_6BG0491010 [Eleusine coracana subsp. coracana]